MTQNAKIAKNNAERKKKRKKEKKKKKKKKKRWRCSKPTQAAPDPGRCARSGPRDLGFSATWVTRFGFFFFLSSLMNTYSSLVFFFNFFLFIFLFFMNTYSSLMNTYFLLLWFSFPVVLMVFFFFLNVNRVLETRFSCRCHVEKVSHQTEQSMKIEP